MSSQQIVVFKQYNFGRTEGKKRQEHKLNLRSLMHKDKIFALLKRLQRELAAVPVCSCCQGFDVYLKSCFSLLGLEALQPCCGCAVLQLCAPLADAGCQLLRGDATAKAVRSCSPL